jgi:hypothetical protein
MRIERDVGELLGSKYRVTRKVLDLYCVLDLQDGVKNIFDDISDGLGSVFECIGASFQAVNLKFRRNF